MKKIVTPVFGFEFRSIGEAFGTFIFMIGLIFVLLYFLGTVNHV